MHIKFNRAKPIDVDIINNLLRKSKQHWGYDENFINTFMDLYKFTADQITAIKTYLMISEDKVLGMYGFKINTNNELQLDSFFIDPEYIGQGLGKKMWLECINTGLKYNRGSFVIEADPNAEEFYIKMGCYKIREIDSSVQKGRLVPILGYDFK